MQNRFPIKSIFLKVLLLALLFNGAYQVSFAQSNKKANLQNQYKKLQDDIKQIETLIASTQAEKSNSLDQLRSINSKINVRQSLIDNIKSQVEYIQKNIEDKQEVITSLEMDILRLKEEYANMVLNAYNNKYNATNALSFLFSSDSFNQAIHRFTYIRRYAKTRQNQSSLIEKTIEDLNIKIQKLDEERNTKESFLNEEKKQRLAFEAERSLKSELIAKLQSDEEMLINQVNKKNQAAQALNNQIQKMIEEEIRLAKEKAAKEAAEKGETVSAKGLSLTPEEQQLSNDFVNNLGKLPWPVAKGFVISKFGKHEHESVKHVYTNNNGIDIKTEKDALVRVVFSGTVVNSFYLPSTQNSVIIKHGAYYSVYSNLKIVSVNAGEKLNTKQNIGVAYTEGSTSKVHLEIWKGMEKTNPELWLAR
ncbi:MAG: peptidoglycan DD-metalloendopeptidase family protein [Chitinophagales bacterium]|nr:peptidoglycan DD-metalloendopeptidase family protein [Chitinophagales bacterium]